MVSNIDEAESTDWSKYLNKIDTNQYESRIKYLKEKGVNTESIEQTVDKTIESLTKGDNKSDSKSFVIFGEPQSGKTEMMIALNMRLLDEGEEIIVNLLTDSVDLLGQNLQRFRESGMTPSPKAFNEIPKNPSDLKGKRWVIFSKKNARDLQKLIDILRQQNKIVVIDDEADYASPNAKVNKDGRTKINGLIQELLGEHGQYIGVTATPARLDLNNTFHNDKSLWVEFKPHSNYVGQDFFFPSNGKIDYRLHTFEHDQGDERKSLQKAVMHFLCGVARLHQKKRIGNYTMLVHTSGKKDDHSDDIEILQKTIHTLQTKSDVNFQAMAKKLAEIAEKYTLTNVKDVMTFILGSIENYQIVEINSKPGPGDVATIATPTSLFSFGAGGNIISRGVTFDNLLSLYFTRSVKGKFSQDTYIQRARMFGSRNDYKEEFQLWIPDSLLKNWVKCFEHHRLALNARRNGQPLVWLADNKTIPTAQPSIDRSTVIFEVGEMSFEMFDYDTDKHETIMERGNRSDREMLEHLAGEFSDNEFPSYLREYLISNGEGEISFHEKTGVFGEKAQYTEEEIRSIQRVKGVFTAKEFSRGDKPYARYHLRIFRNIHGKARLFYNINGQSIKFIRNLR